AFKPELYDAEFQTKEIELRSAGEQTKVETEFWIEQNAPNPFTSETSFNFYLPANGEVSIKLFDLTGRSIYQERMQGRKGANAYQIQVDKLTYEGVYYYQVGFSGFSQTRSMIFISRE